MIIGLKGKLLGIYDESIAIDVNGIVYEVHMAETHLRKIGELGHDLELFTYLRFSNDHFFIYGFSDANELRMFHKLITVNSVGPRNAQAILGHLEVSQITDAILTENTALLVGVPGIGARTASRIVLELKDKLDLTESTLVKTSEVEEEEEVINSLGALGYSRSEIVSVLASIEFGSNDSSLEDKIKLVLSRMA